MLLPSTKLSPFPFHPKEKEQGRHFWSSTFQGPHRESPPEKKKKKPSTGGHACASVEKDSYKLYLEFGPGPYFIKCLTKES